MHIFQGQVHHWRFHGFIFFIYTKKNEHSFIHLWAFLLVCTIQWISDTEIIGICAINIGKNEEKLYKFYLTNCQFVRRNKIYDPFAMITILKLFNALSNVVNVIIGFD